MNSSSSAREGTTVGTVRRGERLLGRIINSLPLPYPSAPTLERWRALLLAKAAVAVIASSVRRTVAPPPLMLPLPCKCRPILYEGPPIEALPLWCMWRLLVLSALLCRAKAPPLPTEDDEEAERAPPPLLAASAATNSPSVRLPAREPKVLLFCGAAVTVEEPNNEDTAAAVGGAVLPRALRLCWIAAAVTSALPAAPPSSSAMVMVLNMAMPMAEEPPAPAPLLSATTYPPAVFSGAGAFVLRCDAPALVTARI